MKPKSEDDLKQESADQEVETSKETGAEESNQTEEASKTGETGQVEGQDNPAFEEEQK